MTTKAPKVLCFDVFGTLTDWYTSITEEGQKLAEKHEFELPWGEFVLRWRMEGYMKMLRKIAYGEMPIQPTAKINKQKLLSLLDEYGVSSLSEQEIDDFNLAWNRIQAWPDVLPGLTSLKRDFLIMPFSNGDYRCLLDISKYNQLPWDGIISADFFKKVKPDPSIYQDAADLLQLPCEQIMMVACHAKDLEAAKNVGFKTAYIDRPNEGGPDSPPEIKSIDYDYDVDNLIELATALGADTANH